MKNLSLLLLFCSLTLNTIFAQALEIGAAVPAFELELLSESSESFTEQDLQGKVTIIEFWASWCSPCVASMKKLVKLKEQFDGDLEVLAVSYEERARIERFINNRPLDLTFGYDQDEQLRDYFPYSVVPHTVLINPKGKVAAITRPDVIKQEVIQLLLQGQAVNLPRKNDDVEFDYQADYFQADTNTLESFVLESTIPNVGTFSKEPQQGPFAGRRASLHNFTIDGLYRFAYQTTIYRMVYEVDEALFEYSKDENKYCLDLIVAPEEQTQLHAIMREKIQNQFDIQGRLEKRKVEVVVLSRPDSLDSNLVPADAAIPIRAGGDNFTTEGATLAQFANYLEDFGIVGMPVVDETEDVQLYAFNFYFEPENPATFHEAIRKMGLQLKKAEREIEVLVIYQGEETTE